MTSASRMLAKAFVRQVVVNRGPSLWRVQPRQWAVPYGIRRREPMLIARAFASEGKSVVDDKIEQIQEQYATAKDEFEIAMEETESNTVYAQDDRDAAREEFDKLKDLFDDAVSDAEIGEEVQRRVGQRIRELESAVKNMEELAQNQD